MSADATVSALVPEIYGLLEDGRPDEALMQAVGPGLDAVAGSLMAPGAGHDRFALWNIDPDCLRHAHRFGADPGNNPWIARSFHRPRGHVVRSDDLLPVEELQRTAFYAEFIEPQGHAHAVSLALTDVAGFGPLLTFHRTADQGPFTPAHRRALEHLGGHIIRAREIRARLDWADARALQLRRALQTTRAAVLVVRADETVTFVSEAAESIVRESRHLALRDGRLLVADGTTRRALGELLRRTCVHDPEAAAEDGFLAITPPGDPDRIVLRVVGCGDLAARCCMVFLSKGYRRVSPSLARLRAQFGLTHAEARVAAALARGQSIREIAAAQHVLESTIKTHLKRIGQKTHTHRQADLVRLVLSIEPWLA